MDGSSVTASSGLRSPAGAVLAPVHLTPIASNGLDPVSTTVLVVVTLAVVASGLILLQRRSADGASMTGSEGSSPREIADSREDVASEAHTTDRDRVREVLRAHGGRTRQTVIVEETGWSKAKVSSVLAEMDDDEEVSKLRVGRENLVSLPGHEPDAVDSPLED